MTESAARPAPVAFRDRDIEAWLDRFADRGQSAGLLAAELLGWLRAILERELAGVRFSRAEALALCDVSNGTLWEPHTASLLWAGVDDAVRLEGLDTKWGIDGPALVEKLRRLCPGQAAAVALATRLFWAGPYQNPDPDAALRAVGLLPKA